MEKPSLSTPNLDDALLEVTLGIRAVAEEFRIAGEPETEPPKGSQQLLE